MKTKLFYLLFLLLPSLGIIKAQNVTIPDANFKIKLLSSSPTNTIAKNLSGNYFAIDVNGDGQIQQSEADQVSAIEIIGIDPPYYGVNPILNYQGILSFTNIKSIKINYWNTPSSLFTISGLSLLENLDIDFQNADPGNASITNCPNLKNFSIKGIPLQTFSNNPALKNVNVSFPSTNASQNILTGIEGLSNLEVLTLNGGINAFSQGPGLNLSNHQTLKKVYINNLSISGLNLSHCNLVDTVSINNTSYPSTSPVYGGALNISYCPLFTNLNINGNITSLTTDNCPNLQSIVSTSQFLSGFSAINCPILNDINLFSLDNFTSNSMFQITGSPNITNISIDRYGSDSFDGTAAVNLEHLYLGSPSYYYGLSSYIFGPLNNLTISNNLKLKTLGIANHKINQLNINGLPKLETVSIGLSYYPYSTYSPQPNFTTEFLQSANIQNCPLLTNISFEGQEGLKTINIKNCPSLPQFAHNSVLNNMSAPPTWELQSLDIEDCNALQSVDVGFNKLTHLKIKNASSLDNVNVAKNELASYEFTNTNNLKTLNLRGNKFTSLNVSTIPSSVISLDGSHNLLTSITGSSSNLKNLSVFSNNLTDLDINSFPNLDSLIMGANKIVDVDFSGHPKIRIIYEPDPNYYYPSIIPTINDPVFTKTFNVNNCTNLESVIFSSTSIEKIFAKNGVNESLALFTPNLQYICCDDSQVQALENDLPLYGLSGVNINTYCNFAPGGNYNTITGTVKFDENNNGCDSNDEIFEHMKLKISNGTTTEGTFVENNGKYNLYTQSGSFTVTTEPENPSLYTVTPSNFAINFVDNNNNISTQNICVTKNGNVKDLEVVIAPVIAARPGFDAVYNLIWRNKGNTTLSGSATLAFDASKMSFVSSELPSTVSGNIITFNFANLKPYQNAASEVKFTINTPTHPMNPVNIGDLLSFTAGVNPISGDVNPEDNQFIYKQTVVGSFDPNDITCLEGNQIPLSMVGKFLHYVVNFENTGTAPATNIVVEMDINSDDFDVSSLQLQNTSHGTYTKVTGNKVEYVMKDINLVASAHGNIALKIKSKNNLVSGDSVSNQANIYFDYNFPVETNEVITSINTTGTTLQTTDIIKNESSLKIYPNPTKEDVNITADSKISSIEVYDAQGRVIQKHIGINAPTAKISIHSTASGIYLFKVITEKETFLKKVIKN